MIRVCLRRAGQEIFVNNGEYCLIGPLQFEGDKMDEYVYRHHSDHLIENRGRYHENDVSHQEITADITQCNSYGSITRVPSQQFPETVYLNGNGYAFGWRAPDTVTVPTSGNYVLSVMLPNGGFILYKVAWTGPPNNKVTSIGEYHYEYLSSTSGAITYVTHGRSKAWLVSRAPIVTAAPPNRVSILSWLTYLDGVAFSANVNRTYAKIFGAGPTWVNEYMVEAAVEYARSRLLVVDSTLEEDPWYELAQRASENFRCVPFNALEFFADLDNPSAMIPKLKRLKDLAGGYLSVHYGLLPTVDDLQSLYKSIVKKKHFVDRNGFQTVSAGSIKEAVVDDISFTLEQHLKLGVDNEDSRVQSLLTGLENMGVMPNVSNLWQLVPYSFVVDWFVGIGPMLESYDSNSRLNRFNVRYVTSSVKRTAVIPLGMTAFGLQGDIQVRRYDRNVSSTVPKSPVDLSFPLSVSNHWLEASALIIQRAK